MSFSSFNMNSVKFVTDRPALVTGKTLVIADLHLGVERDFRRSGIKMPSSMGKMIRSLEEIIKETGPERLVVLGDIKHEVPGTSFQELREIPEFFGHFSDMHEVHVLLGNHDGGVGKLLPKTVHVHRSAGFSEGGIYFTHGHRWPDPSFLKCRYMIAGHRHPVIEFRDKLGYRFLEQVWIRGRLDAKKISRKYGASAATPEVIIMPAFNPLIKGRHALNRRTDEHYRREMGPLINSISLQKAGLYLLDGTYLGTLSGMKGPNLIKPGR
jgi:putative SbcD/Mre11-related phosphoesterase